MYSPGSDGTAERPFQIRSWDGMIETLQKLAEDDETIFEMRAEEAARHVDAVYWAKVHWAPDIL